MESTPRTQASSDEYADEERPEVRFLLLSWGATRGNSGEKFWVGVKPDFSIDTANRGGFMNLLDNCYIIKQPKRANEPEYYRNEYLMLEEFKYHENIIQKHEFHDYKGYAYIA